MFFSIRRESLVAEITVFTELCWVKNTVAYTTPQQLKNEESERLRGEGGQIKFIHSYK